jgi:acetyl esterase/lipase
MTEVDMGETERNGELSQNNQTNQLKDIKVIRDVPYATLSPAQKLDIYLPPSGKGPYPVIIWLHPGGFHAGDKDGSAVNPRARVDLSKLVVPAFARGYALVSINFRLSDEAKFPAHVHDVKAAVRWIRGNAHQYNFNPDKIAVWGSSSGGYLAAIMATSGGAEELEDLSLGNPDQSSRVTAAVDWYGPIDFFLMDAQHLELGQEAHVHEPTSPESRFMGASVTTIPEKCKLSNPMNYVNAANAPIYIQQGKADLTIPYLQSAYLAEKMAAAIGKENVVLDLIENQGHAAGVFFASGNVNKMIEFLDKYMK